MEVHRMARGDVPAMDGTTSVTRVVVDMEVDMEGVLGMAVDTVEERPLLQVGTAGILRSKAMEVAMAAEVTASLLRHKEAIMKVATSKDLVVGMKAIRQPRMIVIEVLSYHWDNMLTM